MKHDEFHLKQTNGGGETAVFCVNCLTRRAPVGILP